MRDRFARRFNVTPDNTAALLRVLGDRAEVVEITHALHLCRDARDDRDDMVVETALVGSYRMHLDALP